METLIQFLPKNWWAFRCTSLLQKPLSSYIVLCFVWMVTKLKVVLCGAVCILSLKLRLKNKDNQIWVWNSSSGFSSLTYTMLNRVWRVNLFFLLHMIGSSLRSFKYFQLYFVLYYSIDVLFKERLQPLKKYVEWGQLLLWVVYEKVITVGCWKRDSCMCAGL